MSTSHRTIKWIENLADQELRILAGESSSIDICSTKDEVLSIESASFVRDLIYLFDYLIRLFNSKVQSELQIKVLRSDNPDNFVLERNQLRLALSRPQDGVVQLQCDKLMANDGQARAFKTSMMFSGRVESKFGTFHDVEWYFLGSRVTAEQLARHYLTEFIQVSRSSAE